MADAPVPARAEYGAGAAPPPLARASALLGAAPLLKDAGGADSSFRLLLPGVAVPAGVKGTSSCELRT